MQLKFDWVKKSNAMANSCKLRWEIAPTASTAYNEWLFNDWNRYDGNNYLGTLTRIEIAHEGRSKFKVINYISLYDITIATVFAISEYFNIMLK